MSEIKRDQELAAVLHGLDGEAPSMNWDALRARVAVQAELPLARRRRTLAARRGMRAIVPLAAAAGIAAVALGGLPGRDRGLSSQERAEVEEILTLSTPDQVGLLMTGEAAEQAMLEAVEDGRE